MKNTNIRALTFVAALVAIIAAGVVLIRAPKASSAATGAPSAMSGFSERIDVHSGTSGERQKAGLEFRANAQGMSFSVPNCDMSPYQSRFFMHVYPGTAQGEVSSEFVGRDFDLAKEPAKRITTGSGLKCVVERSFDVPHAKEVVIGQFTMPSGRCCEIVWSRTYIIEQ